MKNRKKGEEQERRLRETRRKGRGKREMLGLGEDKDAFEVAAEVKWLVILQETIRSFKNVQINQI